MTVAAGREFSNALFEPLLREAGAEDGAFCCAFATVAQRQDRFDREGEFLCGAFLDGNLVAVGGISRAL